MFGCGESKTTDGSSDKNVLPLVSVSLGMSIQQVETGSVAGVRFYNSVSKEPSDNFHNDIPHQLNYVHPTRGFVIPDMDQIAIFSKNGKVTEISDRPIGLILSIDETIRLCSLYTGIIDNAGWQRKTTHTSNLYSFSPMRNYVSLDEVKSTFLIEHHSRAQLSDKPGFFLSIL